MRFVHPVAPGKDTDGWMKPNPEDADEQSQAGAQSDRVLSLEEIAKHGKRVGLRKVVVGMLIDVVLQDDAWIIIDNKVYDVSKFAGEVRDDGFEVFDIVYKTTHTPRSWRLEVASKPAQQ